MALPIDAHDAFFRASMQNDIVAQEFFQYHLPASIRNALDLKFSRLESSSYITDALKETFSDLVFTCRYKNDVTKTKARIALLVEHQSTADRLMPFRVFHYLFNLLYRLSKEDSDDQPKDKLPAVYALVFYHGKQTPYPYSMNLLSCFDDPLGIMNKMFENDVALIDVNQVTDDELERQQLIGTVTSALKYSRVKDIAPHLLRLMKKINSMDLNHPLAVNSIKTLLANYMLGVGKIANVEQFVKDVWQLPEPIRGELMTAAEQLEAIGEKKGLKKGLEKGREEGREEVAINLLKEGTEPQFVARISGLELDVVLKLQAPLAKS